MSDIDVAETFPAMLRRVLGDRLKPDLETFPDMFAPGGVLEYPFAPPGLSTSFAGRDAIIANFQRIRKFLRIDSVFDVTEIGVSDANTVVFEFYVRGEGLITKEPYEQRYISVISMRDGQFIRYKDYWNPLEIIRVAEGKEAVMRLTID